MTTVKHPRCCMIDFRFKLDIRSAQVEKGYLHHFNPCAAKHSL